MFEMDKSMNFLSTAGYHGLQFEITAGYHQQTGWTTIDYQALLRCTKHYRGLPEITAGR